ncbi:MAG: chemotaxis protein CheW [Scytonema sp. PMC 1069.18]|nr:chemotaxis protein CheW [Scytonema sp. PMC 1069.18]MEC4884673.1 chemotaxis protein CheW [Scytonema sp. PMC 1070.18]
MLTTNLDPLGIEPLLPETNLSKLLRFPLGVKDSALLPLEQIAEVIKINVTEILPIPEMPSCVLGICNWRGEMLWLIDIDHLVGYPSLTGTVMPLAIVIQVYERSVGLVVQRVDNIELHDLQQLQQAVTGLFPPKLLPFVLGALPGGHTVLDVIAVAQCSIWQIHEKGVGGRV